ncbi:MAG: recombination mediator RecR [Clostridiales bacterium]|jgi:recombination protein RecR|nr:recombination mediator RecR [Clostridiales bacterium]
MRTYIEPIAALINRFSKLPNVGQKTAMRYAYAVIGMPEADVKDFVRVIEEAREKVRFCSVCGNFTDVDPCAVCTKCDGSVICVVEEPKDVVAMSKITGYKGVFHVLHGTISPMDNRSPDDIRIKELIGRVSDGSVKEVILATSTGVQGEVTAVYIARMLKALGVKATRIAQGISIGSELEYADEVTLSRAIENRREM